MRVALRSKSFAAGEKQPVAGSSSRIHKNGASPTRIAGTSCLTILMTGWVKNRFVLRYSWGFVPRGQASAQRDAL